MYLKNLVERVAHGGGCLVNGKDSSYSPPSCIFTCGSCPRVPETQCSSALSVAGTEATGICFRAEEGNRHVMEDELGSHGPNRRKSPDS